MSLQHRWSWLPGVHWDIPAARVTDDIRHFNEAIRPISMSISSDFKLFRHGRISNGKPHPLKIIFPAKEQALSFITDFNMVKRSADSESNSLAIHVSRDCTLLER